MTTSSLNEIVISTKNPITNWFYGDIVIKKDLNSISINCSKIIYKKITKHLLK